MSDTDFSAGALVTSAWLNEINDHVHHDTVTSDRSYVHGANVISTVQSGTTPLYGWATRNVQGKEGDVLSVKDFKNQSGTTVAGDGVQDDTTGIQSAVTYAAANGKCLYFPKGTYLISSTISYDWVDTSGTMRLLGESIGRGFSGSFVKWNGAAGGTMWKSTGTNSFVMENIGWDGNLLADKLVWCESGVASSDMQFVNCKFTGGRRTTKSVGLQLGSSTIQVSEVSVTRCLFQSCYYGLLSFTANVKNFVIRDGGVSNCFWGICHGSPDSAPSVSGHFLVEAVNFGTNGNTSTGFFNGVAGAVDVGGDLFVADGSVIGCECESSARFINSGATGSLGNNHGHLTLISNHFESSTNVPADDYVVSTAGGITLIGNHLENTRTGSSVAKVKAVGVSTRYASPTALSQGIISIGNWYQNAATYAPLYDASSNLLTDPLSFSAAWRGAVTSYGDIGGSANASLEDVWGTGSTIVSRLSRQNVTDLIYPYSGLLSVGVNKITIPYTAAGFTVANVTARVTAWAIPARTKITNVVADVTTPFSGLAGTMQMLLGDTTGTEDTYLLAFDIKTATITKGLADADLGAQLARATAVQGGVYYWTAGTVRARFNSGAGNWGTGAVTNLSAGSVDIYITVERMP